jgi:hypothetical protein
MMYQRTSVSSQSLNAVECTQCSVMMSSHVGSGGTVRYFHCPKCQRWSSSCYSEVFQADTKMRLRRERVEQSRPVKNKLEQWLASLAQNNPYSVLGCTPDDSMSVVRTRFREMAKQHHPDLGGSAEQMQKVNSAYEEICRQRERHLNLVSAMQVR